MNRLQGMWLGVQAAMKLADGDVDGAAGLLRAAEEDEAAAKASKAAVCRETPGCVRVPNHEGGCIVPSEEPAP